MGQKMCRVSEAIPIHYVLWTGTLYLFYGEIPPHGIGFFILKIFFNPLAGSTNAWKTAYVLRTSFTKHYSDSITVILLINDTQ